MTRKNHIILLGTMLLFSTPALCAKELMLTPLQIQEMQTKQFEGSFDVLFGSVVSVLQDSGYRIDSADKYSGFVRGTAPSKTKVGFFVDKKDTSIVSVFVEKMGMNMQNVRINFVMTSERDYGLGTVSKNEIPVLDRQVYADAFERISKAVFLRSSLRAIEKVSTDKADSASKPQN